MLGLVLILLAQNGTNVVEQSPRPTPHDRHTRENRRLGGRKGGASFAFFEFAPSNGVGMTAPCACTSPTGAKGETLTFTRASNGTCTKTASGGLATTGISNGDLVVCSTNQPRVMYDPNGVLGLFAESTRTNSALQSEDFTTTWLTLASGVAAPTITANAAAAPDGATTADRIQVPATAGGTNYSFVYQSITVTAAAWSASVYLKGNGTSGSTYLHATPDGVTWQRQLCTFVASTWTRCLWENRTLTATAWIFRIGTDRRDAGQSDQGAQDFFAWGFQAEAGAFVSSYIPTGVGTAARSPDLAYFTTSGFSNTASLAASFWSPVATHINGAGIASLSPNPPASGPSLAALYNGGNTVQCFQQGGLGYLGMGGTQSVTDRIYCAGYGGGAYPQANALRGKLTAFGEQSGQGGNLNSITRIYIGAWDTTTVSPGDAIISRVCADPDQTRCR